MLMSEVYQTTLIFKLLIRYCILFARINGEMQTKALFFAPTFRIFENM